MNGLKEICDTFGHVTGDDQFQIAAKGSRKAFRQDDIIARIEGDEFVVLLPETGGEIVQQAVNRVEQVLDEHNLKN